jgi:hypothetical protein
LPAAALLAAISSLTFLLEASLAACLVAALLVISAKALPTSVTFTSETSSADLFLVSLETSFADLLLVFVSFYSEATLTGSVVAAKGVSALYILIALIFVEVLVAPVVFAELEEECSSY